jgi:hypothetical protein
MDVKTELWHQGLRQGWVMRFRPRGSSMTPFIRSGDIVDILPGKNLSIGDIVLYALLEELVMHRVIAKGNNRIITKGDGLNYLDPTIDLENIWGRAIRCRRHGKSWRLDSFPSRMAGLAFSLTVSWIPQWRQFLGAIKALIQGGRKKLPPTPGDYGLRASR